MKNNISAQELFKAGLTREEFIQRYSELQKSDGAKDSSIFTQEFANSIGDIFDTLNAMGAIKNDTLDADELIALQGLGDNDNTTLSEKDLKALYAKMGEELMNKYDKNTTPEQMYKMAMAGGDKTSNTYIQTLGEQISSLRGLIGMREMNSMNLQHYYQAQIEDLIKKDLKLSTEQKTEFIKLSEEYTSLQKCSLEAATKIKEVKNEIKNNGNEIKYVLSELNKIDKEQDEKSYNTWHEDLVELIKKRDDLHFEYSQLVNEQKTYDKKTTTKKRALELTKEEITAGNPELKSKIQHFEELIEIEKTSSNADIERYNNHIKLLENAQTYAFEQLAKEQANTVSYVSHQNDNAMTFDELKAMGLEYSSENGQKLAGTVQSHLKGFTGYCSRHVSNALAESELGTERAGSAADMDTKLENNANFREVKVSSVEDLKRLPAGCILVYERGAAGYNSQHGHIEVTFGDGTAGSDGRTKNIRYSENMSVFIPVQQSA